MGNNAKGEDENQSRNPVKYKRHVKGEGETQSQNPAKTNNKKRKEVFPYGNYRNYYGYRIGQDLDEDPRLKVFRKEWFEGKDCLDIGCNNGRITIQIDLVQDAYWNLRKAVKLESSVKKPANASKLRVEDQPDGNLEQSVTASSSYEEPKEPSSMEGRNLSDVVSFQRDNIVKSHHSPEKRYDTIICMSVTKWVQLNWGDDGLLTLFAKIWKMLRPGGVLVLEPQPWKSYESNRLVSETTAVNYRNIMFRPEQFQEILLDKVGFRTVEDITSELSGTKTGFNRPIWCLRNEPYRKSDILFCLGKVEGQCNTSNYDESYVC
ncbi:probable RNA methyltransferase At5g51130 isoform X2 [Neltuma alba]|uniref:probable RNA methyltransferase At5g51130 isoform X2 n=1 Tax=Neltuma alba TaxID=207710 RepID=UPI0010A561EC|nr:probable RNA methyltransferase At5g51130 isoform X2 [Prosopis alba]